MISILELQNLLTIKEFNPYIDIYNSDKVLLHLIEEIGELVRSYRKNGIYSKEFNNELGDCQILLCFFASSTHTNLEGVTLEKLRFNCETKRFKPSKDKLLELEKLFNDKKEV